MIYIFLILLVLNSWYIYGLWFSALFEFRNDTQYAINMDKFTLSDVDYKTTNTKIWMLRFYSLKYLGEYWSKPVITCPICMASLHSTYIYWTVRPVISQGVLTEIACYVGYVFALSGLNYMLIKD